MFIQKKSGKSPEKWEKGKANLGMITCERCVGTDRSHGVTNLRELQIHKMGGFRLITGFFLAGVKSVRYMGSNDSYQGQVIYQADCGSHENLKTYIQKRKVLIFFKRGFFGGRKSMHGECNLYIMSVIYELSHVLLEKCMHHSGGLWTQRNLLVFTYTYA